MSYVSNTLLGYTDPATQPTTSLTIPATIRTTPLTIPATQPTTSLTIPATIRTTTLTIPTIIQAIPATPSTNISHCMPDSDIDQSSFIDELLEEKRKQILESKRDQQPMPDHTSDEKTTSSNLVEPAKSPQIDMTSKSSSRSKPHKRKPVKNITYKQVTSDLSKEMEQLLLSDSE